MVNKNDLLCSFYFDLLCFSSSVIKVKDKTREGRSWLIIHAEQSGTTCSSLNSSCFLPICLCLGHSLELQGAPLFPGYGQSSNKLSSASTSSREPSLAPTPASPRHVSFLYFPSPSLPWFLPVVLATTFCLVFPSEHKLHEGQGCATFLILILSPVSSTVTSKRQQSTEMSFNLAMQIFPATTFPKKRTARAPKTAYFEKEKCQWVGRN